MPPLYSDNNNSSNSSSNKPFLLLHIGPHKTATSSIQCTLTYLKEALHYTASYEYLARTYYRCFSKNRTLQHMEVDTRRLIECLDQQHDNNNNKHHRCDQTSDWKTFSNMLEQLSQSHRNVILSDEAFSRMKHNDANMQLLQGTLSKHYRVQVVVAYRRYHEWLLSKYNEESKPVKRRGGYQIWPDEGGTNMTTVRDYVVRTKGAGGYRGAAERADLHPTEYLRRLFHKHFDNVVVFNMHQKDGSVVTNFIHQVLPDVTRVLEEALRRGHLLPEKPNQSVNLDWDLLATAARKKGFLRKKLERNDVRNKVAKALASYNATTAGPLPRVCLSRNEQDALLNRSLYLEHGMFPDQPNEFRPEHESSFANARRNFKFCNVDTEALFQRNNTWWEKFFRSL